MTDRHVLFAKVFFAAIGVAWLIPAFASGGEKPVERTYVTAPNAPAFQTWTQADGKSAGCVSCHTVSDRKTMHASEAVVLGCTDCHGGDPTVFGTADAQSAGNRSAMEKAHVLPR
ncbi:MAG TPA: hypothetical protein VM555_09580, partial [Tahibacter sp.]|nr:hypothetical protein [Tahibacter sp.]